MKITRKYALTLVRESKATTVDCCAIDDTGRRWRIVIRHDLCRVDHYMETREILP